MTFRNKKSLNGNTGVALASFTLFTKLPKYLQGRILELISGEHTIIGIGSYDGIQKYYHTSFARDPLPFLNEKISHFAIESLKVVPFYSKANVPIDCKVESQIYLNRTENILWVTSPEATYATLRQYQYSNRLTTFLDAHRLAIPVELVRTPLFRGQNTDPSTKTMLIFLQWYKKPDSPDSNHLSFSVRTQNSKRYSWL